MAATVVPFLPNQIYHVYHHANGEDLLFREGENYIFFPWKGREIYLPDFQDLCLLFDAKPFSFFVKSEDQGGFKTVL